MQDRGLTDKLMACAHVSRTQSAIVQLTLNCMIEDQVPFIHKLPDAGTCAANAI